MSGAAEAPALIRSALYSKSANLTSETGISLSNTPRFIDRGDIIVKNGIQSFMDIERQVSEIINDGALPLVLGGDHAITYPILRAVSRQYGKMSILLFDAHPDLYDELDGNRFSHACPFARIMEEGLAKRLVQVGIRTMNAHQKAQASDSESKFTKCGFLTVACLIPFLLSRYICLSTWMLWIQPMRRAFLILSRVDYLCET